MSINHPGRKSLKTATAIHERLRRVAYVEHKPIVRVVDEVLTLGLSVREERRTQALKAAEERAR